MCHHYALSRLVSSHALDPRWADPIKNMIRHTAQARAINEVVSAFKPTPSSSGRPDAPSLPPLRVMNGISATNTSSILTTAAGENVSLSPLSPTFQPQSPPTPVPRPPSFGQPGNSTIRWTAGLPVHAEHEQEYAAAMDADKEYPEIPTPVPMKPITPSLTTLEKAVAAKIYFENLYFPLLRHPPSREQRRIAMEKEMAAMQLSEAQKENIRRRWLQNETDYLRDRRRKVDVNAFVKLKTIGHGLNPAHVRCSANQSVTLRRCIRRRIPRSRTVYGSTLCHETGNTSPHLFFYLHRSLTPLVDTSILPVAQD